MCVHHSALPTHPRLRLLLRRLSPNMALSCPYKTSKKKYMKHRRKTADHYCNQIILLCPPPPPCSFHGCLTIVSHASIPFLRCRAISFGAWCTPAVSISCLGSERFCLHSRRKWSINVNCFNSMQNGKHLRYATANNRPFGINN